MLLTHASKERVFTASPVFLSQRLVKEKMQNKNQCQEINKQTKNELIANASKTMHRIVLSSAAERICWSPLHHKAFLMADVWPEISCGSTKEKKLFGN